MEPTRIKLAALWAVVMFSITFADIIGFLHPGTLERMMNGSVGLPITPGMLLLFSALTMAPIAMVFLSLVLPVTANRRLNTAVVVITALYIIGGGSASLSYLFFATVELASMGAIIWYAWNMLGKQPYGVLL